MRRQRGDSAPKPRTRANAAPVTLTGRGGVVVVFGAALLGSLLSRWVDMPILAGGLFTAGCVIAALTTRPADLLTLAVSPPAVFFAATFVAVVVTTIGEGSLLRGVAVSMVTALAATAPWVFLGTVLTLLISGPRGLVTAFRDLRSRLAGSRKIAEEENENPVRWDEKPGSDDGRPRALD
ncbi:DUF6542 domain-containing protein [Spirillospora sp. CA-294931]|uniref:DUF6542 domain-containing protein n=1 Tax=Spirillospora sp. CA-294931 TaxID=3240042 RepID=UPI003D8E2558